MSSTNFWKVLTGSSLKKPKKVYQFVPNFRSNLTCIWRPNNKWRSQKKFFWKWQFFWQMRWHRNFVVLYSSTAGMYCILWILLEEMVIFSQVENNRSLQNSLKHCFKDEIFFQTWKWFGEILKCLHIYLYDMIIEDMCLSVKIQVFLPRDLVKV